MAIQNITHIDITPRVLGGRPRIAERRISVADIALLHLHSGWSVDKIGEQLNLTPGQIYAALSYYFDHREAIDQSIQDEEAFVEEFRQRHPSPLDEALAQAGKRPNHA